MCKTCVDGRGHHPGSYTYVLVGIVLVWSQGHAASIFYFCVTVNDRISFFVNILPVRLFMMYCMFLKFIILVKYLSYFG